MRDDKVGNLLYWIGVGFILGCFLMALDAAGQYGHQGHPTDCLDYPPVCDYGFKAVCWCTEDAGCKWYCTTDGSSR